MGCTMAKEEGNDFNHYSNGIDGCCTVCQRNTEGDWLIFCCFCPNIFHLDCHLPVMDQIPKRYWQCLFCKPRDEVLNDPEAEGDKSCPEDSIQFRSRKEYMTACKFMSEVYMIPESVVFRSNFERECKLKKVGDGVCTYSLPSIHTRLTLMQPKPYTYFSELLDDIKKMIGQATKLYIEASDEYNVMKSFEGKFAALCELYLPQIENFAVPQLELVH